MVETTSGRRALPEAPAHADAPRGPRHTARKALLVVIALLSVVVAAGSGMAIGGIYHAESTVQQYPIGNDPGCALDSSCLAHVFPCPKTSCNFLILGSDSRLGLSRDAQSQYGDSTNITGQRSDTMIFVHQDFARDRTTVVSIPRDLRVAIPGHGIGKINSAFGYGADVTVQVVEKLFKMQVNHYIEINFQGFINVVNAMGGVSVCVDKPMIDTLSGLNLPHAGCYTLKGAQALAFVRARHVQGDSIPDFSRISRQQQFLRAALQKMQSPGQLANVPRLIDALSKDFVRDSGLKLYDIKELSAQLANVGQGNVDFRVVPAVPATGPIDGVDYVLLQQPGASKFFSALRAGQSLGKLGQGFQYTTFSPAQITVQVFDLNSGGLAARAAAYLRKAGFGVIGVVPAQAGMTKTEILYGPAGTKLQALVASYLPKFQVAFTQAGTPGADVYVVVAAGAKGIPAS
jgi:LCP family protein required for cell wall assembly